MHYVLNRLILWRKRHFAKAFRIELSDFMAQIVYQVSDGVFILCNEGSIFRDCVILHPYYVTHVGQNNAFQMKFRHPFLK